MHRIYFIVSYKIIRRTNNLNLNKGVARGGPRGPGPPQSKWCFRFLK